MKKILLLCILSTCIACLPDYKDLGCISDTTPLETIVEAEKVYITQASMEWFKNNIDLKSYQVDFFGYIAVDAVVLDEKYGVIRISLLLLSGTKKGIFNPLAKFDVKTASGTKKPFARSTLGSGNRK